MSYNPEKSRVFEGKVGDLFIALVFGLDYRTAVVRKGTKGRGDNLMRT